MAYASRSLHPTERNDANYSSFKLELLALKWAMAEKFKDYLMGTKVVVYTDNNPVAHLQSARLGATEQRWVAQLAAFDYEVKYRSGKENANADALSRVPVGVPVGADVAAAAEAGRDPCEPWQVLTGRPSRGRTKTWNWPGGMWRLDIFLPELHGVVSRLRSNGYYSSGPSWC